MDIVLRENIHGLELDKRCVELAAFALALAAWSYPDAGGYRPLPELNVACSGLSVSVAKEEWKQLAIGRQNLRIALDWPYDTFKDAPILGSLLDPAKTDAAKIVQWQELSAALKEALGQEESSEQREVAVVAHGLSRAAMLLAEKYQWVITNVPYLARGKQDERLRKFCEKRYPSAKNDLATVFLDRCLELCLDGGTTSVVLPQNWLFLTSYKKFREKLLKNDTWHMIARLGPQAFQTPMWDFNVQLISLSRGNAVGSGTGLFVQAGSAGILRGLDVSEPRTAADKADGLLSTEVKSVEQAKQLENPDARVALEELIDLKLLSEFSSTLAGSYAGDSPRFIRNWWEVKSNNDDWAWNQTTVEKTCHFGGLSEVVFLQKESGEMCKLAQEVKHLNHAAQNWLRGKPFWGRQGVSVSLMRDLYVSIYVGTPFNQTTATIMPTNPEYILPIFTFCESQDFNAEVRKIDQKLNVTPATLVKVPFNLDHWTKVAAEKYPNGLPKPFTENPTQWIFHGHPVQSDDPLQVALARLLGYRWTAELDSTMELSDEARTLVKRSEGLLPLADDDGIVCIPPVRGEASLPPTACSTCWQEPMETSGPLTP